MREELIGAELFEVPLPEDELAEEIDSLEESDIQQVVKRSLERAVNYHDEQIEPDLVKATEFYKARPYGDEQDGKSQVVTSEVRDATLGMLPSLLRIFCGSEHPVEFRGRGPGKVAQAEQATDLVKYIVLEDNPGFLILQGAMKDALVRRTGIFKWWAEKNERQEAAEYSGLVQAELDALAEDPDVLSVEITEEIPHPEMGVVFSARAVRKESDTRIRFDVVPPEEFVYDPGTRRLDSAPIVAHVRYVPASDLIEMGFDADLVRRAEGLTRRQAAISSADMDEARQAVEGLDSYRLDDSTLDPSQRRVLFAEAYALVDGGEGVSELRRFDCIGPDYRIANGDGEGELVDEAPFSILTPDPEPHTLAGLSNYDMLHDVQRISSQVLRSTMDSLYEAVDPRTEVVAGEVNMADLQNPETSKYIRVTRPGMMREVKHEFVGEDTLPILQYLAEIKENRTGQSKAAQGLDADSLQSSTKAAVAATLSASQQRLEYVARCFAETGIKGLYRGLLRLTIKHCDKPRIIRLRGQYVEVDPRHWDATMDVEVRVGLGEGTPEERRQLYLAVAEKQEQILQTLGPNNPLVGLSQYRHTLARILELSGERNPDAFFKPLTEADDQAMADAAANQKPQADPAQQLVEVEQMKLQLQAAKQEQELALAKWKAEREDDRERDKMAREFEIKRLELEMKFQMQVEEAALRARVEADRLQQDQGFRQQEIDNRAAALAAKNQPKERPEGQTGGDQ